MQNQMELQLFELKQGDMSVADYERRFTELSGFVAEYVDSEEKRAKKFQRGLKPWIRAKVVVIELNTYASALQKAMIIKGESDRAQEEKDNKKRKDNVQKGSQKGGNPHQYFDKRKDFQGNRNFNTRRPCQRNVNQGKMEYQFS